jgi:hypothetical protein
MEHRLVGVFRAVHPPRSPIEYPAEEVQAAILLSWHPHRLLGHYHDHDGRSEELRRTVNHTRPPWGVRVSAAHSNGAVHG